MILDEATSAMDTVTDNKITNLIQTQFSDQTVLTIAHRINTIINYDK